MKRTIVITLGLLLSLAGCSEEVGNPGAAGTTSGGGGGGGGPSPAEPGVELAVEVPEQGAAYLKLSKPEVVALDSEAAKGSKGWDVALSGYDVYINGGLSGPGAGSAFGPLDAETFQADEVPEVPFLVTDHAGGAFLEWYAYDGSVHSLWSRYHLYGVREGDRLWKVQILGYYGEVSGAPVSALFRLRYAEVKPTGIDKTQDVIDLDGTAGGAGAPPDAAAGCLDLGTGAKIALSPAEAHASKAWHLCFRRETISVNGELGGPRGVTATDLDQGLEEPLDQIEAKTPAGEQARFDAVDHAKLTDPKLVYRGDRVVSAFSDQWVNAVATGPSPRDVAWLVVGADGKSKFLIKFTRFEGPTKGSPGTVHLRVKPIQG